MSGALQAFFNCQEILALLTARTRTGESSFQHPNRNNLDSKLPSQRLARRKAVGKDFTHRVILPLNLATPFNHAIFRVT